jgi:hypothetical protein
MSIEITPTHEIKSIRVGSILRGTAEQRTKIISALIKCGENLIKHRRKEKAQTILESFSPKDNSTPNSITIKV